MSPSKTGTCRSVPSTASNRLTGTFISLNNPSKEVRRYTDHARLMKMQVTFAISVPKQVGTFGSGICNTKKKTRPLGRVSK